MRGSSNDHGGAVDAAMAKYGGSADDWLDLSTGINPVAYPVNITNQIAWQSLPGSQAQHELTVSARAFWSVPDGAAVLAAPGASALIARIPSLMAASNVSIPGPTYNEHQSSFEDAGWRITDDAPSVRVVVNPNNPTGRLWTGEVADDVEICIIDESFCDVTPDATLIDLAVRPGVIVMKSFGKFWGLGGLRLGFAIGDPNLIANLAQQLGPWPVSGQALEIGNRALRDFGWANETRHRLAFEASELDQLMTNRGHSLVGGTSLFRLYDSDDASAPHRRLAQAHILTRVFPYSDRWLRLGLPGSKTALARLEAAL